MQTWLWVSLRLRFDPPRRIFLRGKMAETLQCIEKHRTVMSQLLSGKERRSVDSKNPEGLDTSLLLFWIWLFPLSIWSFAFVSTWLTLSCPLDWPCHVHLTDPIMSTWLTLSCPLDWLYLISLLCLSDLFMHTSLHFLEFTSKNVTYNLKPWRLYISLLDW